MTDIGKKQQLVGRIASGQLVGEYPNVVDHGHVIGGAVNEQHRSLDGRCLDPSGTASQPQGMCSLEPWHRLRPPIWIDDR